MHTVRFLWFEHVIGSLGRARCWMFGVHNVTCRGKNGHQLGRYGWPRR